MKQAESVSEAPRLPLAVDYIALGLPARRYSVRATIGYDARVPLLTEFALRLIRIVGDVPPDRMRVYFGLSEREWDVLLDELLRAGLVECEGDVVRLSRKGRALFVSNDTDDPRIAVVEEFNQNVAFERASMSPLDKIPYDLRPARSIMKLPVKNRERAANGSAAVRESFKKNFAEIGATYLSKRTTYERAYVYSVDDVVPKRTFLHEVELPIELDIENGPSLRVNYHSLERGRYGSRDELLQAVATVVNSTLAVPRDVTETWNFVRDFDQGVLSQGGLLEGADTKTLERFALRPEAAGDRIEETVRFVGAVASVDVAKLLIERMRIDRFADRAPSTTVYWVRPSILSWGRSSRFEALLSDLRASWGSDARSVLLASSNGAVTTDDLRHWFAIRPAEQLVFNCCVMLKDGLLPRGLELLVRPGMWVVAIGYFSVVGSELPLPVGFYSENSDIVAGATRTLGDRIGPIGSAGSILWQPAAMHAAQVSAMIDRELT